MALHPVAPMAIAVQESVTQRAIVADMHHRVAATWVHVEPLALLRAAVASHARLHQAVVAVPTAVAAPAVAAPVHRAAAIAVDRVHRVAAIVAVAPTVAAAVHRAAAVVDHQEVADVVAN